MNGNLKMMLVWVGSLASTAAWAQDVGTVNESPDVEERDDAPPTPVLTPLTPEPLDAADLPVPTLEIERLPANTSYEFAMQVSFGQVAYFTDVASSWPGFGLRAGWGKNLGGNSRIGVSGAASIEGEFGIFTLLTLEPGVAFDFVGNRGGLFGVTAGPSFVHTRDNSTVLREQGFALAPYVAARVGWSQTFSSVGRRLFLYLEPKVRFTEFGPVPIAAFVVGSGGGR
ncbi:MAG: hypothetical protein AAGA48_23540 [Myxococcota bacterium]